MHWLVYHLPTQAFWFCSTHKHDENEDKRENTLGLWMSKSIRTNGSKLFSWSNQYEHFTKCIHKVIEESIKEFRHVGIEPGDLGLHSVWKDACSFVARGQLSWLNTFKGMSQEMIMVKEAAERDKVWEEWSYCQQTVALANLFYHFESKYFEYQSKKSHISWSFHGQHSFLGKLIWICTGKIFFLVKR